MQNHAQFLRRVPSEVWKFPLGVERCVWYPKTVEENRKRERKERRRTT